MIQVIKDERVPDFKHKTEYSAGYDLYACVDDDIVLDPGETKLIPTGIKVNMTHDCPGCMALVLPRSGMSLKTKFRICNSPGIIDMDYLGEICIIGENTGSEPLVISKLERIAQLVFLYHSSSTIDFVKRFDDNTVRGENGFGSTGTK